MQQHVLLKKQVLAHKAFLLRADSSLNYPPRECAAPARTYLAHPRISAAGGHVYPTIPHSTTLPKAYMEVLSLSLGPWCLDEINM